MSVAQPRVVGRLLAGVLLGLLLVLAHSPHSFAGTPKKSHLTAQKNKAQKVSVRKPRVGKPKSLAKVKTAPVKKLSPLNKKKPRSGTSLKPGNAIVAKGVVRSAVAPVVGVSALKQPITPVQKSTAGQPAESAPAPVARNVCTLNGKTYLMVSCNDPVPDHSEPAIGAQIR